MELSTCIFATLTADGTVTERNKSELGNLRIEDVPSVLLNVDHEELSFITKIEDDRT